MDYGCYLLALHHKSHAYVRIVFIIDIIAKLLPLSKNLCFYNVA